MYIWHVFIDVRRCVYRYRAGMDIDTSTHISVYTHLSAYTHIYVHTCNFHVCIYPYKHGCCYSNIFTWICTHLYITYMDQYIELCMSVYTQAHTCPHVCVYIHYICNFQRCGYASTYRYLYMYIRTDLSETDVRDRGGGRATSVSLSVRV